MLIKHSAAKVGIIALSVLALAALACSIGGDGSTGGGSVSAPSSCDDPAQPIAGNSPTSAQLAATTDPYPANCNYYCTEVPSGKSSLDIALRNLTEDLDLYVGFGSIAVLQGSDLTQGENYTWKSNEFGTADENVTVDSPEAGTYYIEICSYEGKASDYQIEVSVP